METNAVLKDLVYTFLTNAFAEVNKVARIARKLKLKERFSAKVLHVRIAHPFLSQGFIAQIEKIFQHQATDHQTDGDCMFTLRGVQRSKLLFKIRPVYLVGQQNQLVAHVNETGQLRTE